MLHFVWPAPGVVDDTVHAGHGGVETRIGQLDGELVAYRLGPANLDDANLLRPRLDEPERNAHAKELLRDGGVVSERPTYREDSLGEVSRLRHASLDDLVEYGEAAQLQSEPLDVHGEQDGATSGGRETCELVHTSMNSESQIVAPSPVTRTSCLRCRPPPIKAFVDRVEQPCA